MQENRRSFTKKLVALVGVGAASVGLASTKRSSAKDESSMSNGVVVGHSTKKEILYTKSTAWEDYYRTAH